MIIQIYEIQEPREAEKCIELGVDHMGSVLLSETSWRISSLRDVFQLTNSTSTKNSLIPLFQNPDILYRALDYYKPHIVHFCETLTDINGREIDTDPLIRYQCDVKRRFPEISIMRSIPIPENRITSHFPTLRIARAFEPESDIFLTDTWLGKEPVEGYIGITGKTVAFETAKDLVRQSKIPVILAGGLSPENVYDAVLKTRPAGADSCTQTNRVDKNGRHIRFEKDFNRVEEFIRAMRRAEKIICQGVP